MSLKCIEPRPLVVRYIRVKRKHRGGDLGAAIAAAVVFSESRCDSSDGASETRHRDAGGYEASSLLLKELEESNLWARWVLQLYFGWFALQFTVNGFAIGWLVTRTGSLPWFGSLIFLVFIVWNLMGAIGAVLVYKGLAAGDERMKQVIEATHKLDQTGQHSRLRPQSSMPRVAITTVFAFCVITMFISLAFWIVMFVAGGR